MTFVPASLILLATVSSPTRSALASAFSAHRPHRSARMADSSPRPHPAPKRPTRSTNSPLFVLTALRQQGSAQPWSPLPTSIGVSVSAPASVDCRSMFTLSGDSTNLSVLGTSKLLSAQEGENFGIVPPADNTIFVQIQDRDSPTNTDASRVEAIHYGITGIGPDRLPAMVPLKYYAPDPVAHPAGQRSTWDSPAGVAQTTITVTAS